MPETPAITPTPTPLPTSTVEVGATPMPTRTVFPPGEKLPYQAQAGDTLPALAVHFNTTVELIRMANPSLPEAVTTLPAGFPMEIPAYHLPITGTPFKILPDSEVVNGPTAVDFRLRQAVLGRPGFLSTMNDFAFGEQRESWQVVETVAMNYSIHPRLLLTILEHQSHALTQPFPEEERFETYPLGLEETRSQGLYRQLLWAAERINDGYYGWRTGRIRDFETVDGFLVRPDPWQNAGTVAVQYLLAGLYEKEQFDQQIVSEGFQRTYRDLWGDPFAFEENLIPGNLQQPELALPFVPGRIWDFTGGPHPTWGDGLPWGALDFAPPAVVGGCTPSREWVAAPADGVVTRSGKALLMLDLDGDGDDRTGWSLLFFHMENDTLIPAGTEVSQGDRLGHPSCDGGRATGTHFHMARRYNGEWIPAVGPLAFTLDRWVAHGGEVAYEGTLRRGSRIVPASVDTTFENQIVYETNSGESQ
ncbi:MAG: LysM peptidoglycan-binding domain-containing M23 family metallopeptidase [Anaerolineales bacterium]